MRDEAFLGYAKYTATFTKCLIGLNIYPFL